MPKLLGFDVWVEMEGTKLQEYNTEANGNGTEISCWIPCEAGKVSLFDSAEVRLTFSAVRIFGLDALYPKNWSANHIINCYSI